MSWQFGPYGIFQKSARLAKKKADLTHYCEHFKMFLPAAGCNYRRENTAKGTFCRSHCDGTPFRPATATEMAARASKINEVNKEKVMAKAAGKKRMFEIVVKYLTELGEKGAIMSQISRRVNSVWPECPMVVTRETLRKMDLNGQLDLSDSGSLGRVYLKGQRPESPRPEKKPEVMKAEGKPTANNSFPDSFAKMAEELKEVDYSSALPRGTSFLAPAAEKLQELISATSSPNSAGRAGASAQMPARIAAVCDHIKDFLINKNQSYGNSIADPVRIFSKSDPLEQINVRIDDKLSRLLSGAEYPGDDTELDLIGYLIMKRVLVCDPTGPVVK